MLTRTRVEILAALALALLGLVAGALPPGPTRTAIALPLVLVAPGLAVVAALFPRRGRPEDLEGIARVAIALAISLAVSALVGTALNIAGDLTAGNSVIVLALATAGASAAGWARDRGAPIARPELGLRLPAIGALVVAACAAVALALAATLADDPRYALTEFYVLGADGRAIDYPTTIDTAAAPTLLVGVVNREGRTIEYVVVERWLTDDGLDASREVARAVTLASGARAEMTWSLEPPDASGQYDLLLELRVDGRVHRSVGWRVAVDDGSG